MKMSASSELDRLTLNVALVGDSLNNNTSYGTQYYKGVLSMKTKLTQKETSLLKDQQTHEKVCIQKYQTYASQAQDPQLKQLLTSYADQEQQHLNTLTQMLSGQVPSASSSTSSSSSPSSMSSSTGVQSSATSSLSSSSSSSGQSGTSSQSDRALCSDMLMTEKFVSGAYDSAIFECADTNMRQALNHIQKEEQEHGNGLFQYMQSKGMYTTE